MSVSIIIIISDNTWQHVMIWLWKIESFRKKTTRVLVPVMILLILEK